MQWLTVSATDAARALLGCHLIRYVDGHRLVVRIVETEAYDESDEASHTFRGETARNTAMFQDAGTFYVYFTYGMYYCMNIVCGMKGQGSGVLIRAVEPIDDVAYMYQLRPGHTGPSLTNGPAKACQALKVTKELYGHDLMKPPMILERHDLVAGEKVVATTRIGIKVAVDKPWRFYIADNQYISRK